ncbi:MAG: ferritin family protein [candidate division NC10 bacterium]|nr:ferritin family protein [candidate division NC10 bacterium]
MERTSWEQLLNRAIAKEQEAFSNYQALAKWVNDPGGKQMLSELAQEEKSHREILEGWKQGKMKGGLSSSLPDSGLLAEGRDFKVDKDLTPQEAVRLAIREEERAFSFYQDLSRGLEEGEVKKLAERLAAEEKRHRSRLEALLGSQVLQEM